MDYLKRHILIHFKKLTFKGNTQTPSLELDRLVKQVDQYLFSCRTNEWFQAKQVLLGQTERAAVSPKVKI